METWKNDRIASALSGTNPTLIAKMNSGFVFFGDTQFLPGYCVLTGYPEVFSLNDLSLEDRAAFLTDMTIVGDAITAVLNPLRMNYEILGNSDNYLHAHIFPRYEWEEERLRKGPVAWYPLENWSNPDYDFSKFLDLKAKLEKKLNKLMEGLE